MSSRYGITRPELDDLVVEWGEPRYRANQVWDALYRQQLALEDATALPRALRDRLTEALPLALEPLVEQTARDGMTSKWLWSCTRDDAQIETVLMRYPERATVCVSSQAGCAMGCTFCATGQAGFERHLDVGEIVEQVLRAATRIAPARQQRRVHGDGRTARQLRHDVGGGPPSPRRPRALGPSHHHQHRRRRARHASPRAGGPAGHAGGVAPRADRRRARARSCRSTAATRSPRCSTPPPNSPAPRAAG